MKLVIIDGNAILHRAFHALPPMTGRDGQPTHAIYGFIVMLLRIVQDLRPSHLAVCFDRPEPTFRKSMYVGYQANRPEMDNALSSQIDSLKNLITAMNVPIYELAGFEADDLIGTLAKQAYKNNFYEIVIITGDRDILQLVNDKVHVYMPIQGLTNAKMYYEKDVEEKYGLHPIQVIDYKALAGDASDNYPGVRGIGPKTASTLIQRYGTIEGIYDAIREKKDSAELLKEKTIKALADCAEDCVMAKKLATIVTDVPISFDMEKTELHDLNTMEAQEEMELIGFNTLRNRLSSYRNQVNKGKKEPSYAKASEGKKKKESEQLSLV